MARSAAANLILEHDTNIADRHIRMSVKDSDGTVHNVETIIPGRLSLDSTGRQDGWVAPAKRKEFKGSVADALLSHREAFEKLGLRVVEG